MSVAPSGGGVPAARRLRRRVLASRRHCGPPSGDPGPRRIRRRATGCPAASLAGQQRLSRARRGLFQRARPADDALQDPARILRSDAPLAGPPARSRPGPHRGSGHLPWQRGSSTARRVLPRSRACRHRLGAKQCCPPLVPRLHRPGLDPAWPAAALHEPIRQPQPHRRRGRGLPGPAEQGPVIVDCGEADETWPSCLFAQAILSLLGRPSRSLVPRAVRLRRCRASRRVTASFTSRSRKHPQDRVPVTPRTRKPMRCCGRTCSDSSAGWRTEGLAAFGITRSWFVTSGSGQEDMKALDSAVSQDRSGQVSGDPDGRWASRSRCARPPVPDCPHDRRGSSRRWARRRRGRARRPMPRGGHS